MGYVFSPERADYVFVLRSVSDSASFAPNWIDFVVPCVGIIAR